MHAARAIHKQREKREEKARLDVRRPSANSQSSRRVSRSPAVSVDTSARKSQSQNDVSWRDFITKEQDNLNFSYIGFIIAVFGAVPLIVGTFVEVPALWEIGLGVTLLGLFIGVVFWCTELCAEAKRFSQKKNQLSTRGKIEDSNLLHVPDRKFRSSTDSRRSSFQSDSVSLISPAVQHYSPKHHPNRPQLAHNTGSRHSISQYSSDFSTSSGRANGHLVPPSLVLRGNGRRDDSRVVSLVQPDPGLDDDSDSDAETVIEAPASHHGNTKVIQVQTCQEKQHSQYNPTKPLLGPSFNIENEKISPLSQQHRTIRMPVMPQEIDKLQRCECGRYLLTERDKLIGIRLPGIGGSSSGTSGSTTTSNSPTPTSSLPMPIHGAAKATSPRNKTLPVSLNPNSIEDSINDTGTGCGSDATTPLADLPLPPPPNKIISVSPSVKIAPIIPPTPLNASTSSTAAKMIAESTVQVDPTLSSSTTKDILAVASARKKTESLDADFDDDDDGGVTPGNEYSKAFHEAVVVIEEEDEKILTELLELNDANGRGMEVIEVRPELPQQDERIGSEIVSNDENHNMEPEPGIPTATVSNKEMQLSVEGSRRRLQYQSQVTSVNRPTSLPLPASLSLSAEREVKETSHNIDPTSESHKPSEEASVSVESSSSTAAKTDDTQDQGRQMKVQSSKANEKNHNLTEDMSLDELLDSIDKNQDGEVLAVVVQ